MSTICKCISFGCGKSGGKSQSKRTLRRHAEKDVQCTLGKVAVYQPINEWDQKFQNHLFQTHWSCNERVNRNLTLLEYIFEIMREFVSRPNGSKDAVSNQLTMINETLLENQIEGLPKTFDAAVNIINMFLMPLYTYDVCPNDCVIFRNQFIHNQTCPKCCCQRFKIDGKTPIRTFTYFPITPRIRRMVQTKSIYELLIKHLNDSNCDYVQSDKHHARKWKHDWFGKNGLIADVDIGIVLSLCLDGVNPFKSNQVNYSMWPIELTVDNFPPNLRKSSAGIIVAGIIPGNGTKEPNIDAYLELLTEELLSLENFEMMDHAGKKVRVSVRMLQLVLDYPAIGKLLHLPGSARSFRACPFCQIVGESCSCNKTLFLQNRRFLNKDHPLRKQSDSHVGGSVELRQAPLPTLPAQDLRNLRSEYSNLSKKCQKEAFTKKHGVKGNYPLMKLSYHNLQHDLGPDMMHILKNAGVNISKILNGFVSQEKVCQVEEEKKGFILEYSLNNEEIIKTNELISRIIFPRNATGCKKSFLTETKDVFPTHAWHKLLAKNVMLYVIRKWSNLKLKRSMTYWLSVMNRLVRYEVDVRKIPKLKNDMYLAACLMERDFPVVYNVITTHLLLHEVETLEKFGPVHSRWMFYYERLNSFITRRVMNRKCPESSAMRTIQIADFVNDVLLANRLNCVKQTKSNVEQILMDVVVVSKSKKRKLVKLSIDQKRRIEKKVHLNLQDDDVRLLEKYGSKRRSEIGAITYESGNFVTGDYSKSSRYIFIKSMKKFGEILIIFEHTINNTNYVWFEVNIFTSHQIDFETNIPFSRLDCSREMIVTDESHLSLPLIVGIDEETIWFISFEQDSDFKWLESHINGQS